MVEAAVKLDWWTVEIEGMPHFDMAMKRVYAWFENEIIDRPPVRFQAHNAFLATATEEITKLSKEEKKAWWFDVEIQVELFVKPLEGRRFHGETFPIYFPNLGPNVYAAFYGADLIFGEVTSWSVPFIRTWDDVEMTSVVCILISLNHRITKGSPKTGVRACARTPVFGYSFNFRDLLNLD